MAIYDTVYKCSLSVDRLAYRRTPSLPTVDGNPNKNYSFVFNVNFQHVVELFSHADGAATEIGLSDIHPDPPRTEIPSHEFFSAAPTVVRDMLSRVNVPPHIAESFAPRISSSVWDLITSDIPCFSAARVLPLSLNVTAVTTLRFFDGAGDGEEEKVIDRITKESTEGYCSICLEEVSLDCDGVHPKIVQLPCSHLYHKDCITLWLEIHHTCPNCRRVIPTSVY